MLDCHKMFAGCLRSCALALAMCAASAGAVPGASARPADALPAVRFDAVIELNAPLCRTHVVLFARYWVSSDSYRVAVVWAEPNAGAINFPIYPPTLNVVSDPNRLAIRHQLLHFYDGVYARPFGPRGPFRHRFNSYHFSDVRFAEQEAIDLRIKADEVGARQEKRDENRKHTIDANRPLRDIAPRAVRTSSGRLAALDLLDAQGDLLKRIEYEYAEQDNAAYLRRQGAFLPQRPITVGFNGQGPTITIAGEKRRYAQLETTHHSGGRKCTVDYRRVRLGNRLLSLPHRITVYSGDGQQVLRWVRLYNFARCQQTPAQADEAARACSLFDPGEMKCRELLLKYWVKDPADVNEVDANELRRLRRHFAATSPAGMTPGAQLKRVNLLLQLDWMLGETDQLETDFEKYLAGLRADNLNRMVLLGGQHVIETTIRWGYIPIADKLLARWLDAAVACNGVPALLDFTEASLKRRRFYTPVKLLDAILPKRELSPSQRFLAHGFRCLALARISEMLTKPDYIETELGVAQARWAFASTDAESVRHRYLQDLSQARELYDDLERPTRQQKILKARLDKAQTQARNPENPDQHP